MASLLASVASSGFSVTFSQEDDALLEELRFREFRGSGRRFPRDPLRRHRGLRDRLPRATAPSLRRGLGVRRARSMAAAAWPTPLCCALSGFTWPQTVQRAFMVKFLPPQGQIQPIHAFSALSRWAIFSAILACIEAFLFEPLRELELEELELELETTFTAPIAARSCLLHRSSAK